MIGESLGTSGQHFCKTVPSSVMLVHNGTAWRCQIVCDHINTHLAQQIGPVSSSRPKLNEWRVPLDDGEQLGRRNDKRVSTRERMEAPARLGLSKAPLQGRLQWVVNWHFSTETSSAAHGRIENRLPAQHESRF